MRDNLWELGDYLAPYRYIIDSQIVEFDIAKANISVLYTEGYLSKQTYDKLYEMDKHSREVQVGYMMTRNSDLYPVLSAGIAKARHFLFEKLGLSSASVLSIKNDAVYVIFSGPVPPLTDIVVNEYVKFRPKAKYRSFYRLCHEWYYTYDPVSNREGLDIKGMNDYSIQCCSEMIHRLCDVFFTALQGGTLQAYKAASRLHRDYLGRQLPIDCYRRLDRTAKYDLQNISQYGRFQADILDPSAIDMVDPEFNATILRSLECYYAETRMQ